ncbi:MULTISPECIES: hypothetical protein [unclassified Paracoccus (in: a-proteobacteria)]|uniref:hypothetical protein n=1 Tax=unclassified Paracoccus (in: a-proteobacteria) TaxID=2688777 RepID=UPI00160489EE|nr:MULTISPECIES: hypothetical protein [unclassified Paracoccus (in: a-proteobacteria)]MBB1492508.1 hypothetical protein [Paracoccus sp. MC1854]MBB1499386.1 hypothetical protein [Paracoccus sp. MC1862]QQO43953.1 hypothetical protein JGR78_11050 [Paracoccus sp. MC1862]
MSYRLTIAACLALPLLTGTARAQDAPQKVGVSVEGAVVEVPVDLAAQACGVSAETLLDQWKQLDTQIATMAETSVAADATDLAPVASPEDTQKASGVGPTDATSAGDAGTAGAGSESTAAAPAGSGAEAAGTGDLAPVVAAASPDASAAENPQKALDDSAAPTEGTALSKAAVCEIDAQKAAGLGIKAPD